MEKSSLLAYPSGRYKWLWTNGTEEKTPRKDFWRLLEVEESK
jgi:hypothetical protein